MMGADIPADFIEDILVRLGCAVEATDDAVGALACVPPTFRPDLEREIDLYEEVLRLWGMDRIPPTLPGGREPRGRAHAGAGDGARDQRHPARLRHERDHDLLRSPSPATSSGCACPPRGWA